MPFVSSMPGKYPWPFNSMPTQRFVVYNPKLRFQSDVTWVILLDLTKLFRQAVIYSTIFKLILTLKIMLHFEILENYFASL